EPSLEVRQTDRVASRCDLGLTSAQDKCRVAVALVRRPGGPFLGGCTCGAGLGHCIAECHTANHRVVERGREGLGGLVAHRPAGGDDGTDADAHQRPGQPSGQRAQADSCVVAAVDEHELRDYRHRLDEVSSEAQVTGQHRPGGVPVTVDVNAMTGEVDDLVVPQYLN